MPERLFIMILMLFAVLDVYSQSKEISIVFSANNNGYYRDCG